MPVDWRIVVSAVLTIHQLVIMICLVCVTLTLPHKSKPKRHLPDKYDATTQSSNMPLDQIPTHDSETREIETPRPNMTLGRIRKNIPPQSIAEGVIHKVIIFKDATLSNYWDSLLCGNMADSRV